MAILSRDDFFSALHTIIADDTSDEAISFLENMTDTYNDLESRSNNDGGEWERKYNELDETWKKRYSHRFFSGGDRNVPDVVDTGDDTVDPSQIKIDDLFTKKEDK